MNYILDTCVISELRKKKPNRNVIRWIESENELNLYLSVLTVGEIEQGISALKDEKQSKIILEWLYQSLIPRFTHRILPIDEKIVREWGKMRGNAQKQGIVLPVIDSLIAATALCHTATVVTQNQFDFERCGCLVFDPWK